MNLSGSEPDWMTSLPLAEARAFQLSIIFAFPPEDNFSIKVGRNTSVDTKVLKTDAIVEGTHKEKKAKIWLLWNFALFAFL